MVNFYTVQFFPISCIQISLSKLPLLPKINPKKFSLKMPAVIVHGVYIGGLLVLLSYSFVHCIIVLLVF